MNPSLEKNIDSLISQAKEGIPGKKPLLDMATLLLETEVSSTLIHKFLELGHFPGTNRTFYHSPGQDQWFDSLMKLIRKSGFHVGTLLDQRIDRYGDKPFVNVSSGSRLQQISYHQAGRVIRDVTRSLAVLTRDTPKPVIGIYTPNSVEGAWVDLVCLSSNVTVVPIPENVTLEQLMFILKHAGITHVFIGGTHSVTQFQQMDPRAVELTPILLPNTGDPEGSIDLSWESFIQMGSREEEDPADSAHKTFNIDEVSTIMYTSGTTADPKGITFTQMNMISKRFARALALPDLSSDDVFLCYLPLYHTFGRFFELMGALFWGATYSFAESPAFKTLLKDFKIVKPSIFISVPKRWIQLYDHVDSRTPMDTSSTEQISKVIQEETGGQLKLGLSAAGYLDPDIFRFFQRHNIHLLSGYGMTEATGGITMTLPEDYQPDSVGKILPGIDAKLAEDGELLLRGPYVTPGYHGEETNPSFSDGWFHTGDLFKKRKGHYFIIGRKKEIYKNSRGQTISPQKIENLFQDFDAVKSVFLVGDGREYNTVLIYPDHENTPLDLTRASESSIRDYFSSLVLSVNGFLAPYERIVNFAIIPRDFSTDHGERTPKGTYKRQQILENFIQVIEPMYKRNYSSLVYGNYELRIPNWLLREKGILRSDLGWDGKSLFIRNHALELTLEWSSDSLKIGDFYYHQQQQTLDIQSLLRSPELWLGNQAFVAFIGESVFRIQKFESQTDLQLVISPEPYDSTGSTTYESSEPKSPNLKTLHEATVAVLSGQKGGLEGFGLFMRSNHGDLTRIGFNVLLQYRSHPDPDFRIRILETLLPQMSGELFGELLYESFQYVKSYHPDKEFSFDIRQCGDSHFRALLALLERIRVREESLDSSENAFIQMLLFLISDYGILHPTSYIWARSELTWWHVSPVPKPIYSTAEKALYALINGFRAWIGQSLQLTIDRESGAEYIWSDVVLFDENVEPGLQNYILEALSSTSLLREAIFLFSKNRLIQLNDIQRNGIWVSFLGRNHGKSVFRVLVHTRDQEAFNFVINVNEDLSKEFIQEETRLLVVMGSSFHGSKLVEDYGGHWPEYNLFTEEYVPGETVYQYLKRNKEEITDLKTIDRWQMRWLHFIWNGVMAYIEFWRRSGFTLAIADPSSKNLIIPEYDYVIGTRLISISDRKQVQSVAELFLNLYEHYIEETERQYPGLKRMSDWEVIFTCLLQVTTVKKGVQLLRQLEKELKTKSLKEKGQQVGLTIKRIDLFIKDINANGVLTKQVTFAALRYERWLDLNRQATLQARAAILKELYSDYGLGDLLQDYPETRVRFFLMTCFQDSNPTLIQALERIMRDLRARTLTDEGLQIRIHSINEAIDLSTEEQYFLSRLVFKHLEAADYVELISREMGDKGKLELVALTEDDQGERYRIRPPFHPKEIARFHSLLMEANLPATFQSNHEFLIMINMKDRLVGGIYWKETDARTAHIEWIVLHSQYQKRHLSYRLTEDLFKRLQNKGINYLTVGFFQEALFYKLGFRIDKQFGGLVKYLE